MIPQTWNERRHAEETPGYTTPFMGYARDLQEAFRQSSVIRSCNNSVVRQLGASQLPMAFASSAMDPLNDGPLQ